MTVAQDWLLEPSHQRLSSPTKALTTDRVTPSPRSWPPRRSWDGEASLGVNRLRAKVGFAFLMHEGHAVKTAIDRAAEAIEVAETLFADEMGATLDLSRAAKAVLTATIAAAIEVAIAEEHESLVCAQ
jgi:hypothetical protein